MSLKRLQTLVLVALIGSSLSGCVGLLVGGATVGGVLVASDRRTAGAQADDQAIEMKIANQITNQVNADRPAGQEKADVSVVSYNRAVLLAGEVPNTETSEFIERIARAQPNVRAVYNHLEIAPIRTVKERTSDTWVTSKVRSNVLGIKNLAPNQFKVVTVRGVAYVFGILKPEEQAAVVDNVRQTSGVQKVVTLFETYVEK